MYRCTFYVLCPKCTTNIFCLHSVQYHMFADESYSHCAISEIPAVVDDLANPMLPYGFNAIRRKPNSSGSVHASTWPEYHSAFDQVCWSVIECEVVVAGPRCRRLKINERIEYKLLSLTYKTLATAQPSYLHRLISVQPPRATRSSFVVTLSRPPTSSSLKITNRSFRYASPHLWNQLPVSFRQPCTKHPADDVTLSNSPSTYSPLSPSITHSLFHSRLKTHLFHKSFPP